MNKFKTLNIASVDYTFLCGAKFYTDAFMLRSL